MNAAMTPPHVASCATIASLGTCVLVAMDIYLHKITEAVLVGQTASTLTYLFYLKDAPI